MLRRAQKRKLSPPCTCQEVPRSPQITTPVQAIGMGDGTAADFRAISTDLFGDRTFDDTSAWTYKYNTSYALPEFGG